MPLREQQQQALEALDWIFSQDEADRASGRTYTIAVALIRQAARFPGARVDFIDHISTRDMRQYTGELIGGLVASDPRLDPHKEMRRDSFRLNLFEPIDNWLPLEPAVMRVGRRSGMSMSAASMAAAAYAMRNFEEAATKIAMIVEPAPPSRTRYERLIEDDDAGCLEYGDTPDTDL